MGKPLPVNNVVRDDLSAAHGQPTGDAVLGRGVEAVASLGLCPRPIPCAAGRFLACVAVPPACPTRRRAAGPFS